MARDVDPRRTRKAQRLIDKLQREKEASAEPYSGWEDEFLTEVGQRLDKFGSAFRDLSKCNADAALSNLQAQKLKEIALKAAGKTKPRKGFTTKKPLGARKQKRT